MTASTATYRLQLGPDLRFDDAAALVPYLASLGVSHLYLSPILGAVPGSTHGYDVVDHTRVSDALGGRAALEGLAAAAHAHGLRLIVDVVPNHTAFPQPLHANQPLWQAIRDGIGSPFAGWFDIDWTAGEGRFLLPVLDAPPAEEIATGRLHLAHDGGPDGTEPVLRYGEAEFPVRADTLGLPLSELVAGQSYRLAARRDHPAGVGYRRFLDHDGLIALRVEDPDVWTATHRVLVDLARRGVVDGFRIDHIDGLVDPAGYLARLRREAGHPWILVEKVLAPGEELPADWECDGTTGYDGTLAVQQVLTRVDPPGVLDVLWAERSPDGRGFDETAHRAKLGVLADLLVSDRARLLRLLGHLGLPFPEADVDRSLTSLLASLDRYRAYVAPGGVAEPDQEAVIASAAQRAAATAQGPDRGTIAALAGLAAGHLPEGASAEARKAAAEFAIRFQQVAVTVMAKGVEDTAFYQWWRLAGANEVGGEPGHLELADADFHTWCARRLATSPRTMTASTTHDTKRSEDVRARSMVLAADAAGWADWVATAERLAGPHRPLMLDRATEYLLWQTVVTAWPITSERLVAYLVKAVREGKTRTSWQRPDVGYEEALTGFARAVLGDAALRAHVASWQAAHTEAIRAAVLGLKLVTLTIPGVPDLYQGSELELLSLVDPDNRSAVDWADRRHRLDQLTARPLASDLSDEKLALCRATLTLRRAHPEWFSGPDAQYVGLSCSSPSVLAFGRGDAGGVRAVVVVSRGISTGDRAGDPIAIPDGDWRELLSGRTVVADASGATVSAVLGDRPVALLVRAG